MRPSPGTSSGNWGTNSRVRRSSAAESAAPLVTVVIPVRDGAALVGASVQSVLGQTYRNVECVVVDDGSEDGTLGVLAGFGDRIRVISQPQRGAAAARNAGVSAANGPIVAFLDADDLWFPNKLAEQVPLMTREDRCGAVLSGYQVVDADLRPRRYVPANDVGRRLLNAILLRGPSLASSSTALVDRALFESVGGYHEGLRFGEDLDLFWRLWRRGPMAAVERPLASYRRHHDQVTASMEGFEKDAKALLDRVLDDGFPVSRGIATAALHAYLGWRHLVRGEPLRASRHLGIAAARDLGSVPAVPIHALRRRLSHRSPRRVTAVAPSDAVEPPGDGVRLLAAGG